MTFPNVSGRIKGISMMPKELLFTAIPPELADDPWFKVVDFLQQNWAVIINRQEDVLVVFYDDGNDVFDQMSFPTMADAEAGLLRNGFEKFNTHPEAYKFIVKPDNRFYSSPRRIYSSGEFWH